MHQQAAPVDVPQEIVAQTRALAGALDDAGDVRHDEADAPPSQLTFSSLLE